jgi:peptide-methionine (R)-S-oxide reductase
VWDTFLDTPGDRNNCPGRTTTQRRTWLKQIVALGISTWPSARALVVEARAAVRTDEKIEKLNRPKAEWRRLLSQDAFRVLFEGRTERPFTSPLNREKRAGTYLCAACALPLFSSTTKFESGTGWPSFYQPIAGRVDTARDFEAIEERTEYHCRRCGGHQGHVFADGPPPTRQRWCDNGVALTFIPEGDALPPL